MRRTRWCSPGLILGVAAVLVAVVVTGESLGALGIVIMEGGFALAVLGSAGLAGGWILQLLGLGASPWRYRLIIGAGLGVGVLSLVVLALGSAGLLTRPVSFVLCGVLGVAGLARFARDLKAYEDQGARFAPQPAHWIWLAVCPFLAIGLLAACMPPGMLWMEEAFGYDALEYHLAAPKTFHDQGVITFLPYNVYTNFPLNSEMLSLLMMTLKGDAIDASFMAQMTNVILAGLFVAAAWMAGGTFSSRAGMVAGIMAGTLPWIAYLAGIAFVEVGMLAMGMASLAAILVAGRQQAPSNRWLLAAGLLAGLSAGFKYTAVPLITFPLALLALLVRGRWSKRLAALSLFTAGALITFAPWLTRNVMNTGNPLFPLAYRVLGAKADAWDDALEAKWQRAHGPEGKAVDPNETPLAVLLFARTIGDYRMGVVLFVLAGIGAAVNRDRWSIALTAMLGWQVAFWLVATHHYARFAVVMLLPMIVLAGRSFQVARTTRIFVLAIGLLVAGTMQNLYQLSLLYYHHTRIDAKPIHAFDQTGLFVKGKWIDTQHVGAINALEPDVHVMLVGEARSFYIRRSCEYAVVFNRHPLAEAVRRFAGSEDLGRDLLKWLRRRGTTHIVVHWGEIDRLRRSRYGFYPEIDRALFERLVKAGLSKSSHWGPDHMPIATLYKVPQDE